MIRVGIDTADERNILRQAIHLRDDDGAPVGVDELYARKFKKRLPAGAGFYRLQRGLRDAAHARKGNCTTARRPAELLFLPRKYNGSLHVLAR